MGFLSIFFHCSTAAHPLSLEVTILPSWFYLSSEQLFFCMRDAIHICTKLRNLLSLSSAIIIINSNIILSNRVYVLVTNKNFRSFERLCTSLEYLKEMNGSHSTIIHASIIHLHLLTHQQQYLIEFIVIWWLFSFVDYEEHGFDLVPKQQLNSRILQMNNLFEITKEHNKINILYYITDLFMPWAQCASSHVSNILISENHIPLETLNVFRFNVQICKNFFRFTRAMSDTFSICVNLECLSEQEKISMLNSFKTQTNSPMNPYSFRPF